MRLPITIIFLLGFKLVMSTPATAQGNFDLVKFSTTDGGMIEAALFPASSKKVVIFAHGAVFNKESWYFLCELLQQSDISSLAIDFRGYGKSKAGSTGNKSQDILGAIDWLTESGFTNISIVGGSMGGAAVLGALSEVSTVVSKVVLLAPAGGPPVRAEKIDKLFIVSKGEGMYNGVVTIYKESTEP